MRSSHGSWLRSMLSTDEIAERLGSVRERIDELGGPDVRIVAVTKGFGPEAIGAANEVGLFDIGESYAQEVIDKAEAIGSASVLHFIGRIQRNKVRKIADRVDLWHSVSRPEVLNEIGRRRSGSKALVQVRIGDDLSKDGVDPSEIGAMLDVASESGVEVDGLMTIGVHGDLAATRACFHTLRELVDRHDLAEASMGMSGDFEAAVAEGATIVRLGSVLFGPRPH